MTHETLRAHLHNDLLLSAIEAKKEIDECCKSLYAALKVMNDVGVSKSACREVQAKITEYHKISLCYSNLLEDAFCITWQAEAVIRKYIDSTDAEIDRLPTNVTF